jgi:putative PEP-CTERM system TPR-repeat lipoprotein
MTIAPKDVAAVASLATLELNRDRIDVAEPLVQSAEKISRHSPRVMFAKGLLAFKTKRYEDAIAGLSDLLQVMPNHLPTLHLMGRVQYAAGRYDRAQLAFVAYLKRLPSDLQVNRMLAAALLAKGQPHLAANVVAPFVRSTTDVGILTVAADAYRQTGRFRESRGLLLRAIKLAPADPALHTSLALTDLASGARQRGLVSLETAIALGPKNSRADEALIMVLLGAGKVEEAGRAADALERRLPDLSSTHVLKAVVLFSRKDLAAARKSLDRALELDPQNLDAVQILADVDAAEQKPDRRREQIQAILKKNPKHLGGLLALARLDLAQGRHEEGVAVIRRALTEHPQSANALLMLADAQFRHGHLGEAVISARQASELHPYDTRAIAVLAEAQMAMGDRPGAIVTLGKLPALQPDVAQAYLRLAAAQLAAGDTKAAAATVLAALEKEPKHRPSQALLADIYLRAGELDRMQALAAQLLKDEPSDALGHRIEGEVLLARKDYPRALAAFKRAAAIQNSGALLVRIHHAQSAGGVAASDSALRVWVAAHPEDLDTRFYLADMTGRAGRHREAAKELREILRRAPNSARALNDLAWALHASGDKEALAYARQAATLAPTSAASADTLGWILVQQGNVVEGLPALLKAVSLDENDPEIRYHLVHALLKIGDNRRAKDELRKVLAAGKPFPQLAEAQQLAGKLGP